MRRTLITVAVLAGALLLVPTAARAGSWFGLHIGSDGFGLSMGYSTYAPYTSAWHDPSWSIHFETALGPYGDWVYVTGLGRVWRPAVAASWRPYTMGKWVWTAYGWTWVAYEPWGYVPHHFGQWALTGRGWVWVPGHTWRPASVSWIHCGSMVGWYPTAPVGWHHAYRHSYNRGFSHGYHSGYADGWRDARYATWIEWKHFTNDNIANHAHPWHEVEHAVRDKRVSRLSDPPARGEIERHTGKPIRTVATSTRSVDVDGRSVRVVRPEGVERSIEQNAERTVSRGLSRDVSTTLKRKAEARRPAASRAEVASSSERRPLDIEQIRSDRAAVSDRTVSGSPSTTSRDRSIVSREPSYAGSARTPSTQSFGRESISRDSTSSTRPLTRSRTRAEISRRSTDSSMSGQSRSVVRMPRSKSTTSRDLSISAPSSTVRGSRAPGRATSTRFPRPGTGSTAAGADQRSRISRSTTVRPRTTAQRSSTTRINSTPRTSVRQPATTSSGTRDAGRRHGRQSSSSRTDKPQKRR